MATETKDKILRQIYYDAEGFDNKLVTLKKARKIIPDITQKDVDDWFTKQRSQQLKRTRGWNSYVADHKLQQIQADLGDMRQGSDDIEFKYVFVAIDVFTKYIVGIAIKGKTTAELKRAMEYTIAKFGKFEELFTDTEGGLQSRDVIKLLNEHDIKHISTYGKAPFAEKAIHTIKRMIHDRLDGLKLEQDEWVNLIP